MIFKYSEYREFLEHLKKTGKVVTLSGWDGANSIILRHDVDFNIEAAYQLSKIESDCGIRSSFFFLTTCYTYNIFAAQNRSKLREMSRSGFDIGLHFDPTIYRDVDVPRLKKFVDIEAGMLSSIIEKPVKSISLHNPSVHGQYPLFDGYVNAYDKAIFSDDRYLSDSQMVFGSKDPYLFAEKVKESTIQVLLHPLHYSEEGLNYLDIFAKYIKEEVNNIDKSFRDNAAYCDLVSSTDLFSYVINDNRKNM